MVFIMWDPRAGDFIENRYRVSVQKLDRRSSINTKYVRLRWISQGRQFDDHNSFIGWEPESVYHWRMEWGPEDGTNVAFSARPRVRGSSRASTQSRLR